MKIIIRERGLVDYVATWRAMRDFTDARRQGTDDQLWLVEHPPTFTLGLARRREHVLHAGEIPVVETDRGGQVTYHGPGQLVAYPLLDLRRLGIGVKQLVQLLEDTVIELVRRAGIAAERRPGAPGVYVSGAKLAALGLRVRKGCCYHGLALNVDMDLEPFSRINPCGYPGLAVTQLSDLGVSGGTQVWGRRVAEGLCSALGYAESQRQCLSPHDARPRAAFV